MKSKGFDLYDYEREELFKSAISSIEVPVL